MDDFTRLAAFRRAAVQVRDASIIARGQQIEVAFAPGEPGFVDILVRLLDGEAFRSLAASVRLVYQQREPAQFEAICNILHRVAAENLRDRAADLRRQYRAALNDLAGKVTIDDAGSPQAYTAKETFDHWLYGVVFHQDTWRQAHVDRLLTARPRFLWSVQATALQISGRTLDLDDVIADHLAQPRLPRL